MIVENVGVIKVVILNICINWNIRKGLNLGLSIVGTSCSFKIMLGKVSHLFSEYFQIT